MCQPSFCELIFKLGKIVYTQFNWKLCTYADIWTTCVILARGAQESVSAQVCPKFPNWVYMKVWWVVFKFYRYLHKTLCTEFPFKALFSRITNYLLVSFNLGTVSVPTWVMSTCLSKVQCTEYSIDSLNFGWWRTSVQYSFKVTRHLCFKNGKKFATSGRSGL